MPTATCPACGREFQFNECFHGSEVACPAAGCTRRILLPYADGTMPPPPGTPTGPVPAAAYYFRKPYDPQFVIGPVARDRLKKMAAEEKLQPTDEISDNRQNWKPARVRDPGLFAREAVCRTCGAVVAADVDQCDACASKPADEAPAGSYAMGAAPALRARAMTARVERRFTAPRPLTDFAAARAADALVGVANGWVGVWTSKDDKPAKTWQFDADPKVRLAVADRGGLAVLTVGDAKIARVYVVDFQFTRLRHVTDVDGPVHALAVNADGTTAALVDGNRDVRLYRVEPWKRVDRFEVRGAKFELSLATELLAAADQDGGIFIYDLRTGREDFELLSPRRQAACPQMPVRMGFSQNGKRLFAAAGLVVEFPKANVDGINPNTAMVIGGLAGGVPGAVLGSVVNDNVSVVWERYRNSRLNQLQEKLNRQTALRVWEVNRGGLVAEHRNVFDPHPTGLADGYLWPRGPAAVTLGETNAHAFDLHHGHLGLVYDVTDPGEVERAKAARPNAASLIRRVEFTPDGAHALVLVWGDQHIRMVPWPAPTDLTEAGYATSK